VAALDAMHSPSAATVTLPPGSSRGTRTGRRTLGASLGLAAVGFSVLTIFLSQRDRSSASNPSTPDARTIAVLPFENLGDSADAYFADGITDAVRGKLTSLPGVGVIARASSAQYARTIKLPPQIASELGVRYLLTGTVRFAGSGAGRRVQVSPELVEIADGQPQSRWQEPFDAEVKDVFQVQGEIAGKVAEAMRIALGGGTQQQLAQPLTNDPAAYDAYLRGEAAWNAGANTDPRPCGAPFPSTSRPSRATARWRRPGAHCPALTPCYTTTALQPLGWRKPRSTLPSEPRASIRMGPPDTGPWAGTTARSRRISPGVSRSTSSRFAPRRHRLQSLRTSRL
jgi:TolB-like protein